MKQPQHNSPRPRGDLRARFMVSVARHLGPARHLSFGAAALVAMIALAPRAEAASSLVFKAVTAETNAGKGPAGRIYAGPEGVMTLAGQGWKSVLAAQDVARRLNELAEEGLRPHEISVRRQGRGYVIAARGRIVVHIDQQMASVHQSDPAKLAQAWAKNLRMQFRGPYLSLRPLVVPVGESRAAPLKGNIAGPVSVHAETPIVTATWDRARKAVQVFGQEAGRTVLVVSDGKSLVRVPVRAANYAARLSGAVGAAVTGNPASPEVLTRAAKAAVAAALRLEPGAWASVRPAGQQLAALGPGSATIVPLDISAAGEDYLPYHARSAVHIRNEQVRRDPPAVLMVSNSPERLLSHGLWFEGKLEASQSARLLYHHVNGTGAASDLVVELWNLSSQPAKVHVVAGLGGPTRDESWAGHRAAREFLGNRARDNGWVVPIPPRTAVPVLSHSAFAAANPTISGLLELRSLAPADLRVRLYLLPGRSERMPYAINAYSPSPFLGRWVYPQPHRELSAHYIVGRGWTFITIGDTPLAGLLEGDRLAGNYGLIYEISLELINPTEQEVVVAILLEPAGGPARGTLLIDGMVVGGALLRPDSEVEMMRYVLAPGAVRQTRIQTMPEAGSNYPVRLVARAM